MASNGFTLYGEKTMLAALLTSGSVFGKLHVDDPEDGTMNPSSITTREAVAFGAPDSNGVFDLSAAVQWGPFTTIEQVWGVSLWDASTAGNCLVIHEFSAPKNVYTGDHLDLSTMRISLPVVGL